MRPEYVGLVRSSLVMGKHSGRHAFRNTDRRWLLTVLSAKNRLSAISAFV